MTTLDEQLTAIVAKSQDPQLWKNVDSVEDLRKIRAKLDNIRGNLQIALGLVRKENKRKLSQEESQKLIAGLISNAASDAVALRIEVENMQFRAIKNLVLIMHTQFADSILRVSQSLV